MEISKFNSTQAPLRERYKKDGAAAKLTLRARGKPDEQTVTCKVETGRGLAVAGIHPKAGGSGLELCSGDMLLEALVACAGVSLKAAATILDIRLDDASITAEGDVDFRGSLGVTEGVPVGFQEIRLNLDVSTKASEEQRQQLLELVERYCVVFNTISHSPRTDVKINLMR